MRSAVAAAVLLLLYGAAYLHFHAASPTQTCHAVAGWGGDSDFNRPMGLAWSDDVLYVADTEDGTVEQYRADGSMIARWTGFRRPVAVAVTDSVTFVADFLADHVTYVAPDGTVLGRWGRRGTGPGEIDAPAGTAADAQGTIYVSDFYNHRIQAFDAAGRLLHEWGSKGRGKGRFRIRPG